MKIIDLCYRPVQAVLTFKYLGYEISCSSYVSSGENVEVLIFKGDKQVGEHCKSIPEAIHWVEENNKV